MSICKCRLTATMLFAAGLVCVTAPEAFGQQGHKNPHPHTAFHLPNLNLPYMNHMRMLHMNWQQMQHHHHQLHHQMPLNGAAFAKPNVVQPGSVPGKQGKAAAGKVQHGGQLNLKLPNLAHPRQQKQTAKVAAVNQKQKNNLPGVAQGNQQQQQPIVVQVNLPNNPPRVVVQINQANQPNGQNGQGGGQGEQ